MLPLEKELECQLSQIAFSLPLEETEENKIQSIETIARLICAIEQNYNTQDYKIFYENETFSSSLHQLQGQLTSLNLPLEATKKATVLASKIGSILIRIGFVNLISTLPAETIYKHIIPCMSTSQDMLTNTYLTGNTHKAFAYTSKGNRELVKKANAEWRIQHLVLKAQQEDVKSKGFKSCTEAIDYVIAKGYTVLNLRGIDDVTDEIIEKLFIDYPHLKHFMVNSNKITKLPAFSQLQTLDCSGCTALTALPAGMVNLAKLDCWTCTALTSLPAGMVNLAVLTCFGCTALETLPEDMVNLAELDCSHCPALTALPEGMAHLATLCCSDCTGLTALPADMVNLSRLYCRDCISLTALPAGMVNLVELRCSGCTSLTALPLDMVNVATLKHDGCTALKGFPNNFSLGCGIF